MLYYILIAILAILPIFVMFKASIKGFKDSPKRYLIAKENANHERHIKKTKKERAELKVEQLAEATKEVEQSEENEASEENDSIEPTESIEEAEQFEENASIEVVEQLEALESKEQEEIKEIDEIEEIKTEVYKPKKSFWQIVFFPLIYLFKGIFFVFGLLLKPFVLLYEKLSGKKKEKIPAYLFVLPWIIGFLVFGAFPIVYSLFLSFNKVTITASGIVTKWSGLANYRTAFTTNRVMISELINFLKTKLVMVFVINVFAVMFAVLLNSKIKLRGFFRTIFFLPVVIVSGPVMAELVDKNIITMSTLADFKIINIISSTFGATMGKFIADTFSNLIYMFWFSGVQLIVYLTVLQRMDESMYEASEMDGASVWEQFWKITLPSLKVPIFINLVYTLILLATFDDNGVIKTIKDAMGATDLGYGFATSLAWLYFLALALIIAVLGALFFLRFKRRHKYHPYIEGSTKVTKRYDIQPSIFNQTAGGKRFKKIILGRNLSDGLLFTIGKYILLIVMSFAFLYPFIHILLKSIQTPEDILNPTVGLLPTKLYFNNYTKAFKTLGFFKALKESAYYALIPSIFQVIATGLTGYGLAKYKFKGKKIIFAIVIASFIIPPQILMIPTYIMYSKMSLLGSVMTFALPAAFAQGIKNSIFILLFYQSFSMLPKELDEAAKIDGAGHFKIFYQVAIPLSVPIIIVVFIFSFVWYWNETYLTSLYIPNASTLPMQLSRFASSFKSIYQGVGQSSSAYTDQLNDAIYMSGILISIIPLLIVYFILQRWFVKGIDQTGMGGR